MLKTILYFTAKYKLWLWALSSLMVLVLSTKTALWFLDPPTMEMQHARVLSNHLMPYHTLVYAKPMDIAARIQYIANIVPPIKENALELIAKNHTIFGYLHSFHYRTLIDYLAAIDFHHQKVLNPEITLNDDVSLVRFTAKKVEIKDALRESYAHYSELNTPNIINYSTVFTICVGVTVFTSMLLKKIIMV